MQAENLAWDIWAYHTGYNHNNCANTASLQWVIFSRHEAAESRPTMHDHYYHLRVRYLYDNIIWPAW